MFGLFKKKYHNMDGVIAKITCLQNEFICKYGIAPNIILLQDSDYESFVHYVKSNMVIYETSIGEITMVLGMTVVRVNGYKGYKIAVGLI